MGTTFPSTIVCSIRMGRVLVTVNGERIVNWKADFDRLSLTPTYAPTHKRALFVGTCVSSYQISQVELTPISGPGAAIPRGEPPSGITPSKAPSEPPPVPPSNPPRPVDPKPQLAASRALREEALSRLKLELAEDYGKKRAEDKRVFAQKLLGMKGEPNPAMKQVILEEARRLACESGDPATAFSATDGLSSSAGPSRGAERLKVSRELKVVETRDVQTLITICVRSAEESVTEDDYATAAELYKRAKELGNALGAVPTAWWVDWKIQGFNESRREITPAVQEAFKTLKDKPDDPKANLVAGRIYCSRGDWDKGLPMLAKGSDDVLKAMAAADLKRPTIFVDQEALAEDWRAKGKGLSSRKGAVTRALLWYERAYISAKEPVAKARVEGLMATIESELASPPPVNLLPMIDPGSNRSDDGVWIRVGQDIQSPAHIPGKPHKIAVPYALDGEYDLKLRVQISSPGDPFRGIVLATGEGQFMAELGGNEVAIPVGNPVMVTYAVRKWGYLITVDGKKVKEWVGSFKDPEKTGPLPFWALRPDNKSVLCLCSGGIYNVSKITLFQLTGQGQRLKK
jgi:hypothetical protein